MNLAASFKEKIKRGDGRTLRVTVTYPSEAGHELAGEPYPLAGATVWFTGKRTKADPDERAVIRKKTGGEGITVEGNVALVRISAADTAALARETTLVCDVQVAQAELDSEPATVAEGELVVEPDVTRATG